MLNSRQLANPAFKPLDWRTASSQELLERIEEANIKGMGGGGFPSHLKIRSALRHGVNHVLANGVECEPRVQSDTALLQEHANDVFEGLRIVARICETTNLTVAVGSTQAFENINAVGVDSADCVLVRNTPSAGEERILIERVLGIHVPGDQYPSELGILVFNVATLFAICEAVRDGRPPSDRVVTVLDEPEWVSLGTKIEEVASKAGPFRLGSQVTGIQASPSTEFDGITNAIALDNALEAKPCIHCGWCNSSCPKQLDVVNMLMQVNRIQSDDRLATHYEACFECGACVEVCPSHIPLLDSIREGLAEVSDQKKKQHALARFDRRIHRLQIVEQKEDDARVQRMQSERKW